MRHRLKVSFRVEVNPIIGTGHLMEVISLIQALKDKIKFRPIVITNKNHFTLQRLEKESIDYLEYIPINISEQKEVKRILMILKRYNCKDLVIDLQSRSSEFYRYLSDNLRNMLVILDDNRHRKLSASGVVNFSITQNEDFYRKCKGRYFIGPDYALLNPQIKYYKPIHIKDEVETIFINQGGGDPYGLSIKIIQALKKIPLKQKINVILGGASNAKNLSKLLDAKRNLNRNYRLYHNIMPDKIFQIMQNSDLAITAAGNTLYELAYFGIPSIVISHHRRHERVARAFAKRKAAVNLGIGNNIKEIDIGGTLEGIICDKSKRTELSQNIRKIIDGKGVERIRDTIMKMFKLNDSSHAN